MRIGIMALGLAAILGWTDPVWAVWRGMIVDVLDGDILVVARLDEDHRPWAVRLLGVDAPEMEQPYGHLAREYLNRLVGTKVFVRETGKERQDLLIGVVVTQDGRNINQELVSQGLAWWRVKETPEDWRLEALENMARSTGRGLWAEPAPIPPWEWK